MIRFENVHKRYPNGREALSGVTFTLDKGEMAFLTGPSGAGKSTLLKLIALIERPTRGTVLVNSQNTARVPRRKIPYFRQRIGVVFQDHKLLYDRSVFENVALPLVIAGMKPREIGRRARGPRPGGAPRPRATRPDHALDRRATARRNRTSSRGPPRGPNRRRAHWKSRPGPVARDHEPVPRDQRARHDGRRRDARS